MTAPVEDAAAWLLDSLTALPDGLPLAYLERGEQVGAGGGPVSKRFDLFGYAAIPDGEFDPQNEDHLADLGEWDWEATPHWAWKIAPSDGGSIDWDDATARVVRLPTVTQALRRRGLTLLYADHDGPVSVVR